MAHNKAFQELERQVEFAISQRSNFCYETNFNTTPLYWPEHFKQSGYELDLIYLCLDSIDEAKHRVDIRVQNGGHFVAESEIIKRYFDGFENLDVNFKYFDQVHLFDASAYMEEPRHLLSMKNGDLIKQTYFPYYLSELLPNIFKKNK